MTNGAYLLNVDCDHYFNNSKALKEAMCFMMDPVGKKTCYVQFPQRFDGIDLHDRYANRNIVFFDVCHLIFCEVEKMKIFSSLELLSVALAKFHFLFVPIRST